MKVIKFLLFVQNIFSMFFLLRVFIVVNENFVALLIHFLCITEFVSWKERLEKEDDVFFRKTRTVNLKCEKKLFYACHRSQYRSIAVAAQEVKRFGKSQGTCKIEGHCTAALVFKIKDELVTVKYTKTHFGHEKELKHLPIPKLDKEPLIGKSSNLLFSEFVAIHSKMAYITLI